MAGERDPRTDPRPGDVLVKDGKTYEVTGLMIGSVIFDVSYEDSCPPAVWGRIMWDAKSITRGAERESG